MTASKNVSFFSRFFILSKSVDLIALFNLIISKGGKAIMTDPNLPSGTDRVFAAFNLLKNKDDYESIINLQGDMPLIDYKNIQSANIPLHNGYEIGTIATDISSNEIKNENITKVSVDWKEERVVGNSLDFFKSIKTEVKNIHQHVGIYSFKPSALKKFISLPPSKNEIDKKILLTPNLNYDQEIDNGIKKSKIKSLKQYFYNIEPTELTKQIEEITNYEIRKQNLFDEITRLENSDDPNKESKIKNLEKRYTIGNVNFDSVIIADFDESLKSVITSLLYTDVSPKEKYFITLNQWFDESLLIETASQPIYYPSINKKNLEQFENKFSKEFNENPNHLSLLSYDLVGLIYYLSLKNSLSDLGKAFKAKNSFKGKIGIFDIENNKINHRLNFYKVEDGTLKEIF